MIAQAMAIAHPTRVLSLTSIMSSTGDRSLPPARPEAAAVLLLPAPTDRAGNIARAVHVFRTIGSPGFPFDEARVRELAARSFDGCFHPAAAARQLVAILASGSGTGPTLVLVHGLGGSHVNWMAVAPALARDARVLAVDLAGFGRTPLGERSADVHANRILLDRFLEAVAAGPVVLVGNSMGGLVA